MVYSVDGLPGGKAKTAERRLAALLAVKWKREYAEVVTFVRVRMALSIIHSNTLLLRTESDKGGVERTGAWGQCRVPLWAGNDRVGK